MALAGPVFIFARQIASANIFTREAIYSGARPLDYPRIYLLPGSPFYDRQRLHRYGYLASFDSDRLLFDYRKLAGLPQPIGVSGPYPDWDSSWLRGHMLGHYLSGAARMAAVTGDDVYIKKVNYIVAVLAKCQMALQQDGYLAAFFSAAFDRLEGKASDGDGVVVPYYIIHKVMAGLLDAHRYLGNKSALQIAVKMADYFDKRLRGLTEEKIEEIFRTDISRNPQNEFGSMNDVLAELYEFTGDKKYLSLARLFNRPWFETPLANGEDKLCGLHANTHVAQAVGIARCAQFSGEEIELKAAQNFWGTVTAKHSFSNGGCSFNEWFDKPGVETGPSIANNQILPPSTAETCNTHNMLKLTMHLFKNQQKPEYIDFYERALYNHLLASVAPDTGRVTYFTPLYGNFRTYLEGTYCCVGTGLENTARYGDGIYFQKEDVCWVNLYMASELHWQDMGIVIRQNGNFISHSQIDFNLVRSEGRECTLNFRIPHWIAGSVTIKLNNQVVGKVNTPSTYFSIKRKWSKDDLITVSLPTSLRLERAKDDPSMVSLFYGPILLAGELGTKDMPDDLASKDSHLNAPSVTVPEFEVFSKNPQKWLHRLEGNELAFSANNAGPASGIVFRPLYEVHHQRYSVYWRVHLKV